MGDGPAGARGRPGRLLRYNQTCPHLSAKRMSDIVNHSVNVGAVVPKQIEKQPENFEEDILCLRMNFEELVRVLENIGVDAEGIFASSNGAEFSGIDDIKSAPARFSGEPFVRVSARVNDDLVALANIRFRKFYTTVSGGAHSGYNRYSKDNDELAKHVYEELRLFSNQWEMRARPIVLGLILFFTFLSILNVLSMTSWFPFGGVTHDDNVQFWDNEVYVYIAVAIVAILTILLLVLRFVHRRLPIIYNPRTTIWQRHGEATIVGVCASLFTALFTAFVIRYFTNG